MKRLVSATLCLLLFCSGVWGGGKKSEYRTGRLVKVESEPNLFDQTHKASYMLYIQDGSEEHVARYSMTYFGRDRSSLLKPDTDVSYRISGNSLFLKIPDGKDIKARLCKTWQGAVIC